MKTTILSLCIGFFVFQAYSQEESFKDGQTPKKLTKQEKKELKKSNEVAVACFIDSILTNRQFYFEIDYMKAVSFEINYMKLMSGEWVDIKKDMNFLAIDSNKIIALVEPHNQLGYCYGCSFLSKEGNVSQYSVKKMKKSGEGYLVRFRTNGQMGSYDVFLTVRLDGSAEGSMDYNSGYKKRFRGSIIPLEQSRINQEYISFSK